MTRRVGYFVVIVCMQINIVGCETVNSVAPFDNQQAAVIAREWLNASNAALKQALRSVSVKPSPDSIARNS